jgi:DNA polymerase I-like protein with 3'-5' exonuclease and polymerase domains
MDVFIMYCRLLGLKIRLQMHDEILCYAPADKEQETFKIFKKAVALANEKLKLNVTMAVDPKVGDSYSAVH